MPCEAALPALGRGDAGPLSGRRADEPPGAPLGRSAQGGPGATGGRARTSVRPILEELAACLGRWSGGNGAGRCSRRKDPAAVALGGAGSADPAAQPASRRVSPLGACTQTDDQRSDGHRDRASRRPEAATDGVPADPADFADERVFNRVAMRVHAAQRRTDRALRRYWDAADRGPPSTWQEVPPVPSAAFKDVRIAAEGAERVFRTSGTSAGRSRRGEHHVASLDLYRAAARGAYRGALLAQAEALRLAALVPSPGDAPDSSLSTMAAFVAEEPEVRGAWWAFDPAKGVRVDVVRDAVGDGATPVLLLATAFSLVHLLDAAGPAGLALPPGSRIMETGGFKGRAARVNREALYARVRDRLGVPEACVVNEYGMTELLSQSYDGTAGRAPPLADRVHRFPPWVRVHALDLATLRPLPPGEPGLLAVFDLANAGSVCHVLTEDVGVVDSAGGFRLRGRATGAEARGCSLTAESFLEATAAGRP